MNVAHDQIQIRKVTSQPLAVARDRATVGDIGPKIGTLLSAVRKFLQVSNVKQAGHNVVVYWDEADRRLITTDEGVLIEVGVQVAMPFEPEGTVACSATPAGTVAAMTHRGPYEQLPAVHAAVRQWCRDHRRPIAGPNWEIYGDWSDKPDELRTEVFYLLK